MGVLVPLLNSITRFAYFTGENTQLITTYIAHNPVTNFIQEENILKVRSRSNTHAPGYAGQGSLNQHHTSYRADVL